MVDLKRSRYARDVRRRARAASTSRDPSSKWQSAERFLARHRIQGETRPVVGRPALTFATADMLSDIAQCEELFHTASGTAFADIIIAGHRWPIRSKRFRAFLRRRYYQVTGETASTAEIRSAIAPILIGKIEIKCPCDSSAEGAAARARRLAN